MADLKLVLIILVLCNMSLCFKQPLYKYIETPVDKGLAEPLYLSPYIKSGFIEDGREHAKVIPLKGQSASYSGYLTVNEQYNSNMFFWFFPAEKNGTEAPLILWLQGGPGSSSLYGLFAENGPFRIHRKGLRLRPMSWTKEHSVLYIDNPVGTGYSFTNNTNGYAKTQEDVAINLLSALKQFFALFPYLKKNDFYIAGESYGGKYVPALAYKILYKARQDINLKGIAIGNGFSDPVNMMEYGPYLYQLGLIDLPTVEIFKKQESLIRNLTISKQWKKAGEELSKLIDSDPGQSPPSLYEQYTGLTNYYNYIEGEREKDLLSPFIQDVRIRRAIHVGNMTWNNGSIVQDYLQEDLMQTVAPWIQELLKHYRVMFYNGQLDVIVAYPLTENFLRKLNWPGYATAKRTPWKVGGSIAGYVKRAGNLMEVMVRDAGHMVPKDRPEQAYYLIRNFTRNLPL